MGHAAVARTTIAMTTPVPPGSLLHSQVHRSKFAGSAIVKHYATLRPASPVCPSVRSTPLVHKWCILWLSLLQRTPVGNPVMEIQPAGQLAVRKWLKLADKVKVG